MTYLLIYLVVGLMFWARTGFGAEFLVKSDWTQLRTNKPAVRHTQERQYVEWAVTSLFYLLLWPACLAFILLVGLNLASEWALGKIFNGGG